MSGNKNPKLSGIYSSANNNLYTRLSQSTAVPGFDSVNFLPSDFPLGNQHYKEAIEKRTFTSRTFTDGHAGVIIQYSSKNINYLDNENKLQPINAGLHFSSTGWAAIQQPFPTYLYKDGSASISSDEKNKITFNRNCKINNHEIIYSDCTVGEEGMLINNVIVGIDKKIIFYENMIETDYIIRKPIDTGNHDLIFSEEIELPEGYSISPITNSQQGRAEVGDSYVVYSQDKKEKARFKAPVFYDENKKIEFGKYKLTQLGGKNILQIIVPEKWLNDANRAYPITIDPVVTGPVSNYPAIYMNSCVLPNYAKDSMLVTIPAGITITKFIVEDSYFADAIQGALMEYGHMVLSTVCGSVSFSCQGTAADSSGTCYLVPNTDLSSSLSCCFSPSCSVQTFYLTHALARDNYGPGCNQTYIYYSPVNPTGLTTTFSAFIIGKTVETAQTQWSVSPTTVCSDSCTLFLHVTTNYGVPPYTITHPWATGSAQYGTAVGSCNSTGTKIIALTIPNCPSSCGTNPTLTIPPPVIVDVCGDTVKLLSSKSISVNPVPIATASTTSICSGSNLNIPVSSCVTGSSFNWTGSDGSSGTGDINDNVSNTGSNPIVITYSIIPTANGCAGPLMKDSAEINPLPIINGGAGDTIAAGSSAQLNAGGGLTYLWSPTSGLSCSNCFNPLAAPVISTSYTVTGTDEHGCSNYDTVTVFVTQGSEVLYIPNSFTPNDNFLNDLFCVYGTSIKTIDIKIYDRWGELIFHTNDIKQGWDGKFRGTDVEGGVYVYSVNCEWLSGTTAYRNGIVTVLR
jgi:gliding motility-associated-like protein